MIKRILSVKFKQRVKIIIHAIDVALATVCSKTRLSSFLYYSCWSRSFCREQQAVLAGRVQHSLEQRQPRQNSAQLRRNIHRLEKALIMRPRRSVFAMDYIVQTVDLFVLCVDSSGFDQDELNWAKAVLQQYFDSVTMDAQLEKLAEIFALSCKRIFPITDEMILTPYHAVKKHTCQISTAELHELFKRRSSVRWFLSQPVDKTTVEQAISIASTAPSACNRQPFFVKVTNDPLQAANIANLAMGTSGFAHNIQCLAVIIGDLSSYEAERDRHVIYIDASLFAMQLMLVFETLGLSTCPINWPDIEYREKLMQSELGIEVYHRPVMLLAIGYADPEGGIPASVKKGHQQFTHWIKDDCRN